MNEAGTARAVREHRDAARPLVATFGGRIVRIIGDGLLLEFSSVVAAVECAVAIQKLMTERNAETPEPKRILYRVGVNLGDVLARNENPARLADAFEPRRNVDPIADDVVALHHPPSITCAAGSTCTSSISARLGGQERVLSCKTPRLSR